MSGGFLNVNYVMSRRQVYVRKHLANNHENADAVIFTSGRMWSQKNKCAEGIVVECLTEELLCSALCAYDALESVLRSYLRWLMKD